MKTKPDIDYHYKYQKYKSKYHKLLRNYSYQDRIQNNHNYKSDTDKIIDIASNVKILGMAEATHGQNCITKFRMHVFKLLVKKCGYSVFVLEDQYSCCQLINQYIHTGIGNPRDLLMNLMWFWGSKPMLELIKWMRKYNIQHNNILEFVGLDVQSICDAYNGRNDPVATYVLKLNHKNNKIDQDNWVAADGFRDKSMFNTFMKIYDPYKKYFLYAHNYHIAKKDLIGSGMQPTNTESEGRFIRDGETVDWLGCLLSKEFGNKYFAIGNVFTNGWYLETADLIEQNSQAEIKTIYHSYKNSDVYISVANIPSVGTIDSDKLNEGLTITNQPNAEFDAVMKIAHETPLDIISLESPF